MNPESLLRPEVSDRSGYSPQHDPARIILDANESPYDLPESLKEKSYKRLRREEYNRYPDSRSQELRERMSEYLNVSTERIIAGNGSDELIGNLLTACVEPGDRVLIPSPSFSMYEILSREQHAEVESVGLDDNWNLTDEFVQRSRDAKITFLGYPNNPTGECFDRDMIDSILAKSSGLVVLDEAYAEFSDDTYVDRIGDESSLVVLRTLSKAFGLAAARVGFLLGPKPIVNGVDTVTLPYNLNTLSQVTAEVALEHRQRLLDRRETIVSERENLLEFLDEEGFSPYRTDANFILFEPDDPQGLYDFLLGTGIRVRKFSEPKVKQCLRVTIGTPEQNDRFMDSLREYKESVN